MQASLPLVTKPWMYNPLLWVRVLFRIPMSPRADAHLGYTEIITSARLCPFGIPALLLHPGRPPRAGKMQRCAAGHEKVLCKHLIEKSVSAHSPYIQLSSVVPMTWAQLCQARHQWPQLPITSSSIPSHHLGLVRPLEHEPAMDNRLHLS